MQNRRNYYRILHVQPDAPVEIIKSSYRTLMQKLKAHPDLGGDEWNAALINEAYAVIIDPGKRAEYDAYLSKLNGQRGVPLASNTTPWNDSSDLVHCIFCHTRQQNMSCYRDENNCSRCNSPLIPATPETLENRSRRVIARIPAQSRIDFYSSWPQDAPHCGILHDLSLNGIGLRASLSLAVGTVIKLENELLNATARVASCILQTGNATPVFHIGAEFLSLGFTRRCGTFLSTRT